MSGFDRTLRGLSSREMLECARGLLACLTGGEDGAARGAAGPPGIGPVVRGGPVPAAGAAREGRVRRERGGGIRRRAGDSHGALDGPGARESYEWGTAGTERGQAPPGEGAAERAGRRAGDVYGGAQRDVGGTPPGGAAPASGAAFCGPERRYDGAVGARGMEMSRVSDFFRRDSRRYDAGFTLK